MLAWCQHRHDQRAAAASQSKDQTSKATDYIRLHQHASPPRLFVVGIRLEQQLSRCPLIPDCSFSIASFLQTYHALRRRSSLSTASFSLISRQRHGQSMDHPLSGEHDAPDRSLQHSIIQVSGIIFSFRGLVPSSLSNSSQDLQCVANCNDPEKIRRFSQPVVQT